MMMMMMMMMIMSFITNAKVYDKYCSVLIKIVMWGNQ